MPYCHECKNYLKTRTGDAFCALSNKPAAYLASGKPCFEPAPAEPVVPEQSAEPAAVIPDGMKRCSKCGRILPVTEFNKNKAMKDGLQYMCKDCDRKTARGAKKAYRERQQAAKLEALRLQQESGVKVCRCCGRSLPLDQFGRHGKALDGLQPICKECKAEQGRKAHEKRKPTPKKAEKPVKKVRAKAERVPAARSITIPASLVSFHLGQATGSGNSGEVTFVARKADIAALVKFAVGSSVLVTLELQEGGEQ